MVHPVVRSRGNDTTNWHAPGPKSSETPIPHINSCRARLHDSHMPNFHLAMLRAASLAPTLRLAGARWCSDGAAPSLSFIEKAKLKGANSLLGVFTHRNGYDDKFKGLTVTEVRRAAAAGAGRSSRWADSAANLPVDRRRHRALLDQGREAAGGERRCRRVRAAPLRR